jgi:hypothetical protein
MQSVKLLTISTASALALYGLAFAQSRDDIKGPTGIGTPLTTETTNPRHGGVDSMTGAASRATANTTSTVGTHVEGAEGRGRASGDAVGNTAVTAPALER